jgi:hypothetical protein
MAFDTITLAAGIVIFIIILVIIIFLIFRQRTAAGNRLALIRAYNAAPRKIPGSPVLLHGPAGSSGVRMPAGGEPVAFFAAFIMSSGCTLIPAPGYNKPLPVPSSFKIFTTSGDFSVTDAGVAYTVHIIGVLERFSGGASLYSKDQKMNAVLDGLPESVFDDMVTFEAAIRALAPVFAITESGRSITSTVDSRVHTYTQGRDVPPAIADLLKAKIIRPQPGEEITVAEFYIPLKKSIWVFGELDGTDTVRYRVKGAGLFVSYTDPDQEGA